MNFASSRSTREMVKEEEPAGEILNLVTSGSSGVITGEKSRMYGHEPVYSFYWDSRVEAAEFSDLVKGDEELDKSEIEFYHDPLADNPTEVMEYTEPEFSEISEFSGPRKLCVKSSDGSFVEFVSRSTPLNCIRTGSKTCDADLPLSYFDESIEDMDHGTAEERVEWMVEELDAHSFDWYEESRI